MSNVQNVISKFRDAIVQKSESLLGLTKKFSDTANNMETSKMEQSNMRPSHSNIPKSNNCKFAKLVKKYVAKLNGNSRRYLDNIYGVYKRGNLLMIRNFPIKFEGLFVQVNERNYRLSAGLLQLLFKKLPDESLINSNDLDNYRMIIEVSSAYKKHYCVNESIRKLKSKKFYNFIAPMFQKSFVNTDSSLSREDNVNEIEHAREKRGRVEQTNPVAAKKVFESTVNPLKKLITVDTRIDSSLSTSNATDNYYEADHSSEDTSDFSTSEYSSRRRIHGRNNYNFINWRYQPESKKRQWTSDDEEVVLKISRVDVTTAYELDIWDDPNKLVDRLRVLIAEQNMRINCRNLFYS